MKDKIRKCSKTNSIIFSIALSLLISNAAKAQTSESKADYPQKYDVVWTTPSQDSFGSMPLGNGDIGLNVWVEPTGDLCFYISKVNAFDAGHLLPKLGGLRVRFSPAMDVSSLKQILRLEDGSIRIESKDLEIDVMVSALQPLINVRGKGKISRKITVNLEPIRPLADAKSPLPKSGTGGILLDTPKDEIAWCYRNMSSVWADNFKLQNSPEMVAKTKDPILYRTSGCLLKGDGFIRNGRKEMVSQKSRKSFSFTVNVLSSQPASIEEWLKDISPIQLPDWKGHTAYWKEFWKRSYVDISSCGKDSIWLNQCRYTQIPQGSLVYKGHDKIAADENAFQISQRYALERFCEAIASRGEVPPPYNGSIFTMDMPAGTLGFSGPIDHKVSPDGRDWASLSFMWQNTRHPYWSMASRGDYDCLKPGLEFVSRGLDIAKDRCKKIFGIDGAVNFEACWWYNVGVFNWENMPQHLKFHQLNTIEIPAIMCDYYEHTKDADFLNNTLVPYASEAIKYYANRFQERDSKGKMVMDSVGCVETYQSVMNPCTEIGGLKYVLSKLLSFNTAKDYAQYKDNWQRLLSSMPSVPLRTIRGLPLLAVGDKYAAGREICESPELYSVYPFRQAWIGQPQLLPIARQSFHVRTVSLDGTNDGQAVETGGWQSAPVQAACLGLPREAARLASINFNDKFVAWNDNFPANNAWPHRPHARFPVFWECKMDGTPDNDHGANSESTIQNMLLQTDGNEIYLLPAWPEDWDVSFKLHATNNTTVECTYKDGKVDKLIVTPSSRMSDVMDMTTAQQRIRNLTEVALCDHNYLFGLPPMLDAQPIAGKTTGKWISEFGETLRDCKAGPWPNALFKNNVAYIHVFDWPKEGVLLSRINRKLMSCSSITGDIQVKENSDGWLLTGTPDKQHTIVKLVFDAPLLPIVEQQVHAGSYCLGKPYTETRDSLKMLEREVHFDQMKPIDRFEFTIENPNHLRGVGRPFTLQILDKNDVWTTLYQGKIYGLIFSKEIPNTDAKAVRLIVDASKLTQLDVFGKQPSASIVNP